MTLNNTTSGEILSAPKVFIDYWGWPQGCSVAGCVADTAGVIPILEQSAKTFASDTGSLGGPYGTRYLNTQTQYDGWIYPGTTFGYIPNLLDMQPDLSWFSPNAFVEPSNSGYRSARNAERSAAINYFASLGYTVGADAIILLAFPPGSQGLSGACGSHPQYASNLGIQLNYNPQLQCVNAVSGVSNTVVGVTAVFQHEYAEALTDPRGGGWMGTGGLAGETGDLCQNFSGVGGIAVGLQPSTKSIPTQPVIATISDAAGSAGSCVFARATLADLFGIGTYPYHLYHQGVVADDSPSAGIPLSVPCPGAPFAPRVPSVRFARFAATMARSDSSSFVSRHFVSVVLRYRTSAETTRPPRFLGNPPVRALLFDPGGTNVASPSGESLPRRSGRVIGRGHC